MPMKRRTVAREEAFAALAHAWQKLFPGKTYSLIEDGYEGATDLEITLDWVQNTYGGAPNAFLAELYELVSGERCVIVGKPDVLFECPCCGYRTLNEAGAWDICRWCGWEDEPSSKYSGDKDHSSVNRGSKNEYREILIAEDRDALFHRWIAKDEE